MALYNTMYPDLRLPTNLPTHPPSEVKAHFEGIVAAVRLHLQHYANED